MWTSLVMIPTLTLGDLRVLPIESGHEKAVLDRRDAPHGYGAGRRRGGLPGRRRTDPARPAGGHPHFCRRRRPGHRHHGRRHQPGRQHRLGSSRDPLRNRRLRLRDRLPLPARLAFQHRAGHFWSGLRAAAGCALSRAPRPGAANHQPADDGAQDIGHDAHHPAANDPRADHDDLGHHPFGIIAWTWVIIRRWTRKDTPYTAPARIAPARIARAAWTAEFGMGDRAMASSPTTAATARAIGVITGSC